MIYACAALRGQECMGNEHRIVGNFVGAHFYANFTDRLQCTNVFPQIFYYYQAHGSQSMLT